MWCRADNAWSTGLAILAMCFGSGPVSSQPKPNHLFALTRVPYHIYSHVGQVHKPYTNGARCLMDKWQRNRVTESQSVDTCECYVGWMVQPSEHPRCTFSYVCVKCFAICESAYASEEDLLHWHCFVKRELVYCVCVFLWVHHSN